MGMSGWTGLSALTGLVGLIVGIIVGGDALLLETGDYFTLEDGSGVILLET